jgi:hypothetical protein
MDVKKLFLFTISKPCLLIQNTIILFQDGFKSIA